MHGKQRILLKSSLPITSAFMAVAPAKGFCVRSEFLLVKALAGMALMVLLGLAAAPQAFATNYTFTTFDVPGASFGTGSNAAAINDAGQIVGSFSVNGAAQHGFLKDGTTFTTIDPPGAVSTRALGINNAGVITGWFDDGHATHGFVKDGATYTTFDAPGAGNHTFANGINDAGQIVGVFGLGNASQGFLKDGASFTTLVVPSATIFTEAWGINTHGQIVGFFADASGVYHGFQKDGATYTTLDAPSALLLTEAFGINDAGQIVGAYNDRALSLGPLHGFMKDGAIYTTIDVPGATGGTAATGINNAGQVVGTFIDSTGFHAFLATPIVIPVQIEVQPLAPKDPIILNSPVPVPVAVLGSSTVDVTQIDATTLRFGPKGAAPLATQIITVDDQKDLLALFEVQDTGLALGDTQVCLQGRIGGQPFQGCDDIVVIMAKNCGVGFELAPILPALLWLRGRRKGKLTVTR